MIRGVRRPVGERASAELSACVHCGSEPSPAERHLGSTQRIAWHDVYRLPEASVAFINPAVRGRDLGVSWWPGHDPPETAELQRMLDGLALCVIPDGCRRRVGRLLAFDAGRCLLLPPLCFSGPGGRIYRDVNLKGVGPITEFVGDNNPLNRWYACGMTSTLQAYTDLARSEILRRVGVHVPLGLAILDTGNELQQLHHDGRELRYRGAIYVRALSLNTRLHNLRDVESDPLAAYLSSELKHLSAVEGTDLTDPSVYVIWFARRVGQQAARMQRLGYLHAALHPQQLCLDGTLCDFEHETGTGFLANPPPDFTYHLPNYTFGRQPETLAGLVVHQHYDDSLWRILQRAGLGKLPPAEAVLAEYWQTYQREYDVWEAPEVHELVHAFGLDNEPLLLQAFGTELVRENGPPLNFFFTIT
jgi:hypothetical protein